MNRHDVFFNYPFAALLLLTLLPIFYGFFSLKRYRLKQQGAYTTPRLLDHLIIPRSAGLQYAKWLAIFFMWLFTTLALMDPFGNLRYSPSAVQSTPREESENSEIGRDILFLVDTSASMSVPDGLNGESRLEEAKSLMEDIMRQLHEQTVSLYTFGSELNPVVPPTLDYIFTRLQIKNLHINQGDDSGGTRFGPILEALQEKVLSKTSAQKNYTIVLFSDGGDTKVESLKGSERKKEIETILSAIKNPQEEHIRLFTIGLGSLKPQPIPNVSNEGKSVTSKLEEGILKELAVRNRGFYYFAHDWSSWDLGKELLVQIDQNAISDKVMNSERKVHKLKNEDLLFDLYYQIPLGFAILFYSLYILLPDVRSRYP